MHLESDRVCARFHTTPVQSVIKDRNDHQRKQGRYQNAKNQGYSQAIENRVIENEKGPDHGGESSQGNRLRPYRRRLNHRILERQALCHLQLNKVNQQDRISNNDARQCNHADHGGRRELRPHQGVTRHDTNHGEWNRGHDDQRCQVASELRHHQQVDQDQSHTIGSAHVTEGVVSYLQLAIPFEGVLAVGIRWLVNPVFTQLASAGQSGLRQLVADGKKAIQGRIQFTGHVAEHVAHTLQVFGEQGFVDYTAFNLDQFRQGHHLTIGGPQGDRQQSIQPNLRRLRQLQTYRHRVFGLPIVQVGHVGTRQSHGGTLRDH